MRRRWHTLFPWMLALWLAGIAAAHGGEPRTALVLDFDLIDEQADVTPFPEAPSRLTMVKARISRGLEAAGIYRIADPAPIAAELERAQAMYTTLLDCKGCELDLARQLGVERIVVGWVQRVSNLILNLNIEVRDAATGATLLNKSADMRRNNDRSWQRAADFLIRDMAERGQRDL